MSAAAMKVNLAQGRRDEIVIYWRSIKKLVFHSLLTVSQIGIPRDLGPPFLETPSRMNDRRNLIRNSGTSGISIVIFQKIGVD